MDHPTRTLADIRQLFFGENPFTRAELRYVKALLSMSDVHVNLLGDLPLEIVAMVAVHLPIEDFARCLRVCKVWRHQLLSSAVTRPYEKQMWPALINRADVANRDDFLATLCKLGWASSCFRIPGHRADIEAVRWDNMSHYRLDPAFHGRGNDPLTANTACAERDRDDLHSRPSALYSFGKVAWIMDGTFVVIDDLRSMTRKFLAPPGSIMRGLVGLQLKALGSRLVIGSLRSSMFAWDHMNDRPYEKLLPSQIIQCTTHMSKVAMILSGGQIVIWTPGGPVVELRYNPQPSIIDLESPDYRHYRRGREEKNIFLDRRDTNTAYLAAGWFFIDSRYSIKKPVISSHVRVFEHSDQDHITTYAASYQESNSMFNLATSGILLEHDRIVMSEYEYEHSYIIFSHRRDGVSAPITPLVGFDKIERKFVRFEHRDPVNQYESDHAFAFSTGSDFYTPYDLEDLAGGMDLDFRVNFLAPNFFYTVTRPRLIEDKSKDNSM